MRRAITILCAAVLMLLSATPLLAQIRYGTATNGVQVALEPLPEAHFRLHLLNKGLAEVDLTGAFAWLLLAESRERASFTSQVPLDAGGKLPPDSTHTVNISLRDLSLYAYKPGTKLVSGYPDAGGQSADRPRDARVQAVVYLKVAGEATLVRSRSEALVASPTAPTTAPNLLAEFRRDAFAAKAAHEKAIAGGAASLPQLNEGLADREMPDFGLMWIATAVIKINGEPAEALTVSMTSHPSAGVRHVLAYHGPGMNRPAVDKEIVRFAAEGKDSLFTAWAARGFAERGRTFPPELITAAAKSSEPRARAEIAHVLAVQKDAAGLAKLATDDNELVRVAVVNAIKEHRFMDRAVIHALVNSLQLPGEAAREVIVQLLNAHEKQDWQYSPETPESQRLSTLSSIRTYYRRPASGLQ